MAMFKETPSATDDRARYFQSNEILSERDLGDEKKSYWVAAVPLLYLRVIPQAPTKLLSRVDAYDILLQSALKPLCTYNGHSTGRNAYGAISLSCDGRQIPSATQLFRNRELWGFDAVILEGKQRLVDGEELPVIPSFRYEQVLTSALYHYVKVARDSLGISAPVTVEAGASPIPGYHMSMGGMFGMPGPVHDDAVFHRATLSEFTAEAIDGVLLGIFEEFFDAVGERRPIAFNGFPGEVAGTMLPG
jgi:hypothetical protein